HARRARRTVRTPARASSRIGGGPLGARRERRSRGLRNALGCALLLPHLRAGRAQGPPNPSPAHSRRAGSPESFEAPPEPALAPVSIELRADRVTLLHGPGPDDDQVLPAGPYPLVTALRAATPGSEPVIGVFGEIPGVGVTIGASDSDFKAYAA